MPTAPRKKSPPSVESVHRAAIESLSEALALAKRRAQSNADAATHQESRAENDKDTRGLETSYLARGQAMRVAELEAALSALKFLLENRAPREKDATPTVVAGTLLELEDEDGEMRLFFFANAAGGLKLKVGGKEIQVVTPTSPLGRIALGKEEGDDIEFKAGGVSREYSIYKILF